MGACFVQQVNAMRRFALVAVGAAVLAGAGDFSATARAQAATAPVATAPVAQAQAAPSAQAPVSPAATAPLAQSPAAAPVSATPAAAPDLPAEPQGGTIQGTVKASGVPLPGVAVTATNTLTGKKFATTTGIDGAFQMTVPSNGRYVVKTDLTGFASVTEEVVVNASSQNGGLPTETAEFKVDLASRVTQQPVRTAATTAGAASSGRPAGAGRTTTSAAGAVARVGRGTQALAVQGNYDSNQTDASTGETTSDTLLPSLGAVASDDSSASASESIAVTGVQGQTNGLAGFSQDDLQNRIQDMQRNGFANSDIASTLSGVMQTGTFGPGGPGGPGGGGPGGGGPGGGFGGGPGGGGPGGGFGGGGGRGGGGFNGFGGGFRGQNPNAWHGTFAYTGANSALNATSRSFTGTPIDKPQSDRNTLIASFTGTPYIPGWIKANSKQNVFISVQETRNSSPSTVQNIVPTPAQRLGDLTPAYQAQPTYGIPVYDPKYGTPYGNTGCDPNILNYDPSPTMCIPQTEISSAAKALLTYYPLPNIAPNSLYDNYQANFPGSSHSSQISARYNRSFGATPVRGQRGAGGGRSMGTRNQNRNAPPALRQSIAENFAYSHSASANSNFSPLLRGSTATDGYSLSSAYTVGYGRINSSATLSWSRSSSNTVNIFTNGTVNPAIQADNGIPAPGIYVGNSTIYSNPFYYGVPSIGMSGVTGVAGLSDTTPSSSIAQTISFADFVSYTHKKHNMRFGLDFHRIHNDSIGGTNVLGSFTFSGFATQAAVPPTCVTNNNPISSTNPNPTCANGSSVADLLIGQPQTTAITASPNKIYLRGNSWDWYAQDDWRAKSNFTVSYGLRWEYSSPYSEKDDRLVNLQLTGSGSTLQIANVCPNATTGCALTASQFGTPATLVNPDKSLFSPRVAIAWSPKSKWTKNTVVRSGYGINYNIGQYQRFASSLSFQQPFAITQSNTLTSSGGVTTCLLPSQVGTVAGTAMTLTHGFGCSTQTTQSNFGVNPNYRVGMVQSYNIGIQRTLPQGVVLNIDYTGAYAGNLDMVRKPNRTATGILNSTSGQFSYEDSLGYQRSNALSVSARQRMHKGVSLSAAYTYSHSIDDASSVGGSGGYTAQNDLNLAAEESNSSFDRRHSLNVGFMLEPPFGPNRAFLNKGGVWAHILDGYSISGTFTTSTGGFASPQYTGTTAELEVGANYLRPNRVAGQKIKGAGSRTAWFNTAAFSAPAAGTYGTASRNSIQMPGSLSVNGSLSRTVSFGGTRSFEARITANNALNTVQYSGVNTTLNSSSFGQVNGAAGMRSFNYTARFRF
jgi:hypothetical protein